MEKTNKIEICQDLIKKHSGELPKEIKDFLSRRKNSIINYNKTLQLKTGDKIYFTAGYSNNIRYKSEVIGFDKETGKAYINWDCYWYCIELLEHQYKKAC